VAVLDIVFAHYYSKTHNATGTRGNYETKDFKGFDTFAKFFSKVSVRESDLRECADTQVMCEYIKSILFLELQ